MGSTNPAPVSRRRVLISLGKGTGKYTLVSNGGCHAYVLARYEEPPGQLYEPDGTTEISGVFWRTLRVKPDSGLVSYTGTPGRSEISTILDPQRLADQAADLDTSTLVEVACLLPTRNAAIQAALRRYVPRQHRVGQYDFWGVFDTVDSSWPAVIAGRQITDMSQDRAAAEEDADWLNRNLA